MMTILLYEILNLEFITDSINNLYKRVLNGLKHALIINLTFIKINKIRMLL